MDRIPIKVKDNGTSDFIDSHTYGVMPTIRAMPDNMVYLFPFNYREAIRTATSLLRKEGYNVKGNVFYYDCKKYMRVSKS